MSSRIHKRLPPFLFRYRPPNDVTSGYFENLLRENHIWASPPRRFRDWDDCRAQIDFNLTQEEALRYWFDVFRKLGLKGKKASARANSIVSDGGWKEPDKHAKILEDIQGTLDNTGVICVTDTALDEKMWEGYAVGHSGICLCFETSEAPFCSMREVNYVTELPMVRINADVGEQLEAFLLTKSSSFSWEQEWRSVAYNKGGGYKPISPWSLQAVILGCQVEEAVREEVLRLVALWKPNVRLFAVDASRNEGQNTRLHLVDNDQPPKGVRIIPPIQEHLADGLATHPKSGQLLGCLKSVAPEQHIPGLNRRIELLAAQLRFFESIHARRTKAMEVSVLGALREATDLLREIVLESGAAIPGYGEVSLHLYRLVHAALIKSGQTVNAPYLLWG